MTKSYHNKIKKNNLIHINKIRKIAIETNKKNHQKKLTEIINNNKKLLNYLNDYNVAKIILSIIYLCEGTKNFNSVCITLGNSDPLIIKLFLQLLRFCYKIDESKFRCTLQCRADQKIKELEKFWSKTTKIPLDQFYKARIDNRTIGKKTIKPNYKGVCRLEYFSAEIFWEFIKIGELLCLKNEYKGL